MAEHNHTWELLRLQMVCR